MSFAVDIERDAVSCIYLLVPPGLVPPARTGRRGRKLASGFVQVEGAYGLQS
jgi:hypothetical protein